MTTENRRVLRMIFKAMLVICLPLAGFVWALPDATPNLALAGALTVLSLAVAFGAEYLASAAENELHALEEHMAAVAPIRVDEIEHRDERLRQFDRIINVLTDQNNTLRGNLVAIQVDVQRRRDALLKAASGEAAKLGDAAADMLRPSYVVRSN